MDISLYLLTQTIVIAFAGITLVFALRKVFPPSQNGRGGTSAQVDVLIKTSGDLKTRLDESQSDREELQLKIERVQFDLERLKRTTEEANAKAEEYRQKYEAERARHLALLYQNKKNSDGGAVAQKKVILVVCASPDDAERLRVDKEAREIEESVGALLSVKVVMAARSRDLAQALTRHKPRFIHFSGHGINGEIVLQDESGASEKINLAGVASIICPFRPEGIVLNACFSADGISHIIECVEWAVAMTQRISDRGAIAFSTGFYLAMESGDTIQDAFAAGRGMLGMISPSEINIPVLKTKKH